MTGARTPSIEFLEVTKTFGPRRVLDRVSFSVAPGEILFVLGKSGMGKSVTLKHVVGVMKPDSGRVIVVGRDVGALDDDGLAETRRRCGMVFQHPALLDSLTVHENVSFGLRTPQFTRSLARPLGEDEIRDRVARKLSLVHLGPDLHPGILKKMPSELSYGMQKRVSLARTLAPEPEILLFDEPTTGLDPVTTTAVNDLILELSRKLRVTSVVVSHDMGCALKIADRVLVLDQGRILALGTVPEIRASAEPLIRDFLSETLTEERAGGALP